ncbi:Hypothetical protein A7982_10029 [Minicystis rosea]|nr:Hypothetical protein A7982_10029 [Minicystis rosea]
MRTEGTSILAALAIHAGVLLVARTMPPLSLLTERDRKKVDEIEIVDIQAPPKVEAVPEAPPNPDAPRPPEPDRTPPEARVAARTAPAINPGPQAATTAEPQNPPPAPSATSTNKFDDLPPEQRGGVLGVPVPGMNGPVWSMPGVLPGPATAAPAPTVAPAPRPVDKDIAGIVIRDAMAKKDKDIGLDLPMAGSMSSAVRTAVYNTELAAGTKGSIECRVSAAGRVSGCRLVGSNGGSVGAWNQAVQAATAVAGGALSGQYASGAVVTIDISITQGPPSGSSGGLKGAGATFDVSNIGAHVTRSVRTSHRVVAAR